MKKASKVVTKKDLKKSEKKDKKDDIKLIEKVLKKKGVTSKAKKK